MGQKLSEAALASSLGVSRAPVREAFRALEEAGLVTISKNRGVFVREFTAKDVKDLYDIRVGLDEMTGRLLAPKIVDAQIEELRKLVESMQQCLDSGDLAEYFPLNIEFHDRIVQMTGNDKLVILYRRLTDE
ncbi:MAG: FCD domain-containing protein, partial [Pigmentiphaga sp.]